MSAEVHCITHPSPQLCTSIYIHIHAGTERSGSTDSQELRSCWSAGCPLLPSTYFHRLAIKQLNVRKPETWSGLGTLALIHLDETEIQKRIWERWILLSCSPPAVQLQGQPGRSRWSCQLEKGRKGFPRVGGAGKLQVVPCCPLHFCQPPEEGSRLLAPAADAASLGCVSGSETRSWAVRHIS